MKKLLIIKKYINNYLIKKFIRINNFLITVFIFFTKKLKKEIRIYVDYKSLNNVIIKNYYFIFLFYKIINALYKTKIFIKFNIVTTFNYLSIVLKNE